MSEPILALAAPPQAEPRTRFTVGPTRFYGGDLQIRHITAEGNDMREGRVVQGVHIRKLSSNSGALINPLVAGSYELIVW
jgi:hypothetical protein